MADAAMKAPARYATEDRIGMLEELLNERYSVRAFLPQPVPRETLLKNVWGYNANVTTHTLETHIYRLRQKIEDNPAEAQLLVTEGGGYKLVPGGRQGGARSDA